MSGIRIVGLEALYKGISKNMDLAPVRNVVALNGSELQQRMQEEADFKKGYQTGTTKRSISLKMRDGGLTAAVAPGTEYSPYLEYGTRFMEAQPFVKPAFEGQSRIFKSDMDKLVR
ncbi:MAG: HK97 gp10 family phage protein [Lachnospiraceae bacterium]|nr:HK97 gp10 family phage protein [Clostridia bacterium]MBR0085646.1 HK97 gp10 family phage protein [Lachnospiraceae bacterium]